MDGAFLVRTLIKKKKTIILLSVIVKRKMKNYEIKSSDEKFYLDAQHETRKFDSIIQLIDFHYRKTIDLPIQLVGPALKVTKLDTYQFNLIGYSQIYESNAYYDKLKLFQSGLYREEVPSDELKLEDFLKDLTRERKQIYENNGSNYSVIYEIQRNDLLNSANLRSDKKIDKGNFGEVHLGSYKYRTILNEIQELPVAIKKLHLNDEKSKKEIKKEADLMKSLDHPHIIKYIGLCYTLEDNGEILNIVIEYARLGSMHSFLNERKNFPMEKIIKLCYQIASAMEYLASKKIVHRDLAARNVLLVTEDKAKVSDFGLSRYNSEGVYTTDLGWKKWPFRWFSPDLMERGKISNAQLLLRLIFIQNILIKGNIKFDEKSDVWAFGVTWWEATSYSSLPYCEIGLGSDCELLKLRLTNGYFLEKPEKCPEEVYTLMCKCWILNKDKRIKFSQLVDEMKTVILDVYGINL